MSQKTKLKPACGYLRMSSDQQEASIDQQRTEITELAKKEGYEVVRWYVDSGKSGSLRIKDRKAFLQMIRDSHSREWIAVLCWDVQRFSRLDPLKSAAFKDTLRDNGVYLHTVKEGIIKWESFSDHVIDTVYAAGAHNYSLSLSKDTIRGRLDLLEAGEWPNGKVPYGYDKLYMEPDGTEHLVPRLKTFPGKGKGWRRLLVKNKSEAKIVAWLFKEFLENDLSLREIAKRINANRPDGSPNPWTKDTVKEILSNKAYAGYAFIGGGRGGTGRLRAKEVHNRAGYHEKAGVVPAIVSFDQWTQAQNKLAKNAESNSKVRPSEASFLSGVLVCGHCGYRMEKHSRDDRDGTRYVYFSCSSATKRPALGCKQWRVREQDILPLVIERLVNEVDRSILDASQAEPPEDTGSPLDALRGQLAEVVGKLQAGYENALAAPLHRKAHFEAVLSQWEQEQATLERQIASLTVTQGDVHKFASWWESVRGQLVEVVPGHSVSADSPESQWDNPEAEGVVLERSRFRALLKSLGFEVKLWWRPRTCTYAKGPKRGQEYLSDRFYELDHACIDAGGENAMATCTVTPIHSVLDSLALRTPYHSGRQATSLEACLEAV